MNAEPLNLIWCSYRRPKPTFNHYFNLCIDSPVLHGLSYFHHSKIQLRFCRYVTEHGHPYYGQKAFTFPYRLHIVCGNDNGTLPKTPMEVGQSMVCLAQFGNIGGSINSLYNCTQLLLSYKTDHDLVGLNKIEQICNEIGKTGQILCYSKQKKCNVIINYIAHGQGDLMAKNENLNPSVTVGAAYGGTQGVMFENGHRRGFNWKGDYYARFMPHYKTPDDIINNPENWGNCRKWWTLTSPTHGNSMGEDGENEFDWWMEEQKALKGEYPKLTRKQERTKRKDLVQNNLFHGIIRKGHALSWSYMNEIKHIYWRIFINRLCQSITVHWVQHQMPWSSIKKAVELAFDHKSLRKQIKNYCLVINPGRLEKKVCMVKLPGPIVDHFVIYYSMYSACMAQEIGKKNNVPQHIFVQHFNNQSNFDLLPKNFIIQTWHNAVDDHLHGLWQEYLGILHIPQFYPKEQYNDGLPPLLTRSLELSLKIFDLLEKVQPHGVSTYYMYCVIFYIFVFLKTKIESYYNFVFD